MCSLSLGISHCKESSSWGKSLGGISGGCWVPTGYIFVLPCWLEKISVCTFIVVHCNTNRMVRGLAFTLGKKRNTNSYPLSTQVFEFIHSTAMKWATPMYLKRSWLHEGVNKWTG